MVRHEAVESLGSIATNQAIKILHEFKLDTQQIIRESCIVALDLADYWTDQQIKD